MGPDNFVEEVANHVCAYFQAHLQDELAIAHEMREMSKNANVHNIRWCSKCVLIYDRCRLPNAMLCHQCRVVLACGRRFCHVDRTILIKECACQCPPVQISHNVFEPRLVCAGCTAKCQVKGCQSHLCGGCVHHCPSCRKKFCRAHVVKRLCVLCMQEEADAYREKWPNHAKGDV